jgi:hypothetical protein
VGEQEAFCVKYSQDGTMVGVGCGDGVIKVCVHAPAFVSF